MQHSYDGYDRPGGLSWRNLMAPLRHRDFALLWGGQIGSLLGDGAFLVAMAWQVYALSNAPTALSMVGIAMTVPTITLLLLGGVVTDRFDRRRVLLAADAVRGLAVGTLAILAATGTLQLWHMFGLVALYGAEEVSLGDFILSGGEVPALAFLEATIRLGAGALNPDSLVGESFTSGLLDAPAFTRPSTFRGVEVPDVLLSGDHARIAEWRREQSRARTAARRPDLEKPPEGS